MLSIKCGILMSVKGQSCPLCQRSAILEILIIAGLHQYDKTSFLVLATFWAKEKNSCWKRGEQFLPVSLSHLLPSTRVRIPILAQELKYYPNRQFATDLVHDLQLGCRIDYQGPNLKPTLLHPEAVTEALHKEISWGHMYTAGPFSSLPLPTPLWGW